jgi:L-ribulose-5-phosphate 4-epimerase
MLRREALEPCFHDPRPGVLDIVHTHSADAIAFAAVGRDVTACLASDASKFGGPTRRGPFAWIGVSEIGRVVVENLCRTPALLLKTHGAFTAGGTGEAAGKAAVMVEEIARTARPGLQFGEPRMILPDLVRLVNR